MIMKIDQISFNFSVIHHHNILSYLCIVYESYYCLLRVRTFKMIQTYTLLKVDDVEGLYRQAALAQLDSASDF